MGEASGTKQESGASPTARTRKQHPKGHPVYEETRRQRKEYGTPVGKALNFVKTAVAVIAWVAVSPLQVAAIAPYISWPYAQGLLVSIAVMSAALVHLWPTRTPQWRTLFWAFWLTGAVGAPVLYLGGGPNAVVAGALAACIFVFLRMNQNGRKLVGLIRDWRELR